jgi:hypothetical protein
VALLPGRDARPCHEPLLSRRRSCWLEDYTTRVQGLPTGVVVTVARNAAGQAQHIVVNHRPRSSMLLVSRLLGKRFDGTPLAEYFLASES